MASDAVEVFFLPWTRAGHLRPMMAMAKVFAAAGAKASLLAPADAAAAVQPLLDWSATSSHPVQLLLLPSSPSDLHDSLRRLLEGNSPPSCVVFDAFFPWVIDVAGEFSVPAFAFSGGCCFTSCTYSMLARHPPPPGGPAFIPGLPHRVELLRSQLPKPADPALVALLRNFTESKVRSAALLMNSFEELEVEYLEKMGQILGKPVWSIGPLPLVAEEAADESSASCLEWLDGKKAGSVVYICFGSMGDLDAAQLREIGAALEGIGCPFVWVVRGISEEEIFEGSQSQSQRQGLVVTGWAPQTKILNHGAVGAFVTHCGWNSCMEAIAAGVPMVTWPLMADQFFNEKLVTQVLSTGVEVGNKVWAMKAEERDLIGRTDIGWAIEKVIGVGEEAAVLRRRAAELAASARTAAAEGGSSYDTVARLIEQLRRGEWRPKPPPAP